MSELRNKIEIFRASDDQPETASLVLLDRHLALEKIDSVWWVEIGLYDAKNLEMDSHWKWVDIAEEYSQSILMECLAIKSEAQEIEGALAFQIDAMSKLEPGNGCVYVGWLATAPRNRSWLTDSPLFKGVGTVLLIEALKESYRLGFKGRISLQSLPSDNTLKFYKNRGFERTDLSQDETKLVDFELSSNKALEWLRALGEPV